LLRKELCNIVVDDEKRDDDSDDKHDDDSDDDNEYSDEDNRNLDIIIASTPAEDVIEGSGTMPSFSADGGISMPPAFENEREASEMTLLEKVLANSDKQFQPQALRSNQYGACHGQQPSKRTVQRHRQQGLAKKVIEAINAPSQKKISNFSTPASRTYNF